VSTRDYRRYWAGFVYLLVSAFAVQEGRAIWRRAPGDTFSEWVWSKIGPWPMRMFLGALLIWLVWHFLIAGPNRGLGRWDVAFVVLGALVGLAAWRWGWR